MPAKCGFPAFPDAGLWTSDLDSDVTVLDPNLRVLRFAAKGGSVIHGRKLPCPASRAQSARVITLGLARLRVNSGNYQPLKGRQQPGRRVSSSLCPGPVARSILIAA